MRRKNTEGVRSGKLDAGGGGGHQTGSFPRKQEPSKVMFFVRGRTGRNVENGKGVKPEGAARPC